MCKPCVQPRCAVKNDYSLYNNIFIPKVAFLLSLKHKNDYNLSMCSWLKLHCSSAHRACYGQLTPHGCFLTTDACMRRSQRILTFKFTMCHLEKHQLQFSYVSWEANKWDLVLFFFPVGTQKCHMQAQASLNTQFSYKPQVMPNTCKGVESRKENIHSYATLQ